MEPLIPFMQRHLQLHGRVQVILNLWRVVSMFLMLSIYIRLILHEKAHFLYSNVFDSDLLMSWADLGGWTHSSGDNLGNLQSNDGWVTSKQTEFVSAYGHGKNPNEDMAESISYFLVNPDALRSRHF